MKANGLADLICDQARLMFTLLDAADADDRVALPETVARWREVKARITHSNDYEGEAAIVFELLRELDRARALDGTWIGPRWRTVEAVLVSRN